MATSASNAVGVFDLDQLTDMGAWDTKTARNGVTTKRLADYTGKVVIIAGVDSKTTLKRVARRLLVQESESAEPVKVITPERWLNVVETAFKKLPSGAKIRVKVVKNKERGLKLESAK